MHLNHTHAPADEPQPLAYLDSLANRAGGVLDIRLDVLVESAQQRAAAQAATRVAHTSFRHPYWTFAQMVTQHTKGGQVPVALDSGEQRAFLHDGDAVILRGWCEKPGAARIGFGESRGEVLPARGLNG